MKNCPRCRYPYPDEYAVCPKDGSLLEYLQEWQPGDVIREKYRIICKIGQGGMGAIYKAEHLIFEELRALKALVPQFAHDESLVRFLQQEARITRRLSHPNAVRVEDVDRAEDGRLFIAMEYVAGTSIGDIIKQSGPMPVLRVLEAARQLCSALDSAHSLGMIHRDIKPANVLLVRQPDDRDLVKVLDFGIAKIKESAKGRGEEISGITMTKTGFVVGTPQYMSPEQAMGKPGDQLDGRSDLYSVGVLMYEALTGELPFHADTPLGYLLHQVHTPPRSLVERPHLDLPEPIVQIVMKALEKDPADRFQSAREMILAMTAAAETFEKETIIKKVYTSRMPTPDLGAVLPSPPPRGAESLREERAPSPVAVPTPPPGEGKAEVGATQIPDTSREAREATDGGEAALFSKIRFGQFLELVKQTGVRLGAVGEFVRQRGVQLKWGAIILLVGVFVGLGTMWWRGTRPVEGPKAPPASPASVSHPAPTATVTTDHDTIEKGKSVTLSWESENATTLDLQPGIGAVQARGSTTVKAEESTTYTLTASGPGGTKTATAHVTVIIPGPIELSPVDKANLTDKLAFAGLDMDHANYDDAIQAYQEALKIDPSNQQARDGLRKARQLRKFLEDKIK